MEHNEENDIMYEEFNPFLVKLVVSEATKVSVTHFAIKKETPEEYLKEYREKNFRGVANIDVEEPGTEVKLQVYLTSDEEENGQIQVLKKDGWDVRPSEFYPDERYKPTWAGYRETTLKAGDPPIAVG